MATTTAFTYFNKLPLELQLEVWKHAADDCGPMRLDLVNTSSTWDADANDFILPAICHVNVIGIQRRRIALISVCHAARKVCKKQFTTVACRHLSLFFSNEEQTDYRAGLDNGHTQRAVSRCLVLDWDVDLIYLAESGNATQLPWLFAQTEGLKGIKNLGLHLQSFGPFDHWNTLDEDLRKADALGPKDPEDDYEKEATHFLDRYADTMTSLENMVLIIDETVAVFLADYSNLDDELESFLRDMPKNDRLLPSYEAFGVTLDMDADWVYRLMYTCTSQWAGWTEKMVGIVEMFRGFRRALLRRGMDNVRLIMAVDASGSLNALSSDMFEWGETMEDPRHQQND
ncbi:hypothetical protein JX265_000054 [Neoarthrinium moseri]|uniref:2EXR domain-containing protein n=1 Tax=Neoarthrinium moseri TaxID=1658444 RepID=A0A9P9WXR0_9PEZI|nr:hypothetical protein JX265_000054 [Neoarthrinium moseri]